MKTRFVISVVLFGLMSGSVLASPVRFAFTADIISGPGAGGSISGTFFMTLALRQLPLTSQAAVILTLGISRDEIIPSAQVASVSALAAASLIV